MQGIDLFAGCGGLSLGLANAGIHIVAGFEYWPAAVKVYKANFSHDINEVDLSQEVDFEIFRKYRPDIIAGGPPCQDFSSAGKRDENLGRADLTLSYAEIITEIRPQWFIMENVDRIVKSKILPKALQMYKSAGYGLSYRVLDASYCGCPQTRKRFFLIGRLGAEDGFLDYYLDNNLSKEQMTIRDYLGDSLGIEYYYRHPRSYQRRGIFSIDEPSPTVRGVNRPLPKTYKRHPGDPVEPSEDIRPLTTIERSYLQTFPREFKFIGSKSDTEQMIGNAVPVKLAEYVGRCIMQYIDDSLNGQVKTSEKASKRTFDFQTAIEF